MMIYLIGLFIFQNSSVHEFHISKCLIEYAEEEQALQVTLHIFIDDFEEALRLYGFDNLYICTEKESPDAETYMVKYFEDAFKINVNGQVVPFEFLGKEISEDLMGAWCYMELKGISSIETLGLTNSILTEVFDDQKNIVSIIGPNKKKEIFMLGKGDTKKVVQF